MPLLKVRITQRYIKIHYSQMENTGNSGNISCWILIICVRQMWQVVSLLVCNKAQGSLGLLMKKSRRHDP